MTTYDICVKIPQLIDSLDKNVFFQINKKIDSDVGDMVFHIPDGHLLWNFVQPTSRKFRNLFEWCFFFIPFFRWNTHLYMSVFPSICPSVHSFVCCARYLRNYTSSDHNFWYTYVKWWYLPGFCLFFFLIFSKFWLFGLVGE